MPTTEFQLKWDQTGERKYETGVSKGVLYKGTARKGYVWNGLTAVNQSPEGGEPNALYADDIKYLNLLSNEDYKATIEAYTYPDEFAECDGSLELTPGMYLGQQKRKPFGFSYVTKIGNDEDFSDHGYKIHLVYNALAAPSDKNYETVNDTPDAITFSWEISTTPEPVSPVTVGTGNDAVTVKPRPTAHIEIDSTKYTEGTAATNFALLEKVLYGEAAGEGGTPAAKDAYLPTPDEVYGILSAGTDPRPTE